MELSERPPAGLEAGDVLERIRSYAAASRAESTWTAYRSDLEHFATWCVSHGIAEPVPADPHVVAAYLTDYAGELATSTLARRLYALSAIHRLGGHPSPAESPELQTVWSGIKRTHRTAPAKKAATLTTTIVQLVGPLGDRPKDVRDRALLLIGFAGAFRRSELVAFDIADITETDDGLHIDVRRSKADQEGEGDVVGLPYGSNPATCPVRTWRAWREPLSPADGPAFRGITRHGTISAARLTDRAVADMVKQRAKAAGLDAATFSGHSLRAGFATEAFRQGVPEVSVMRHGRWKTSSAMRGYIREGGLWGDNAAAKLGL